MLTGNPTEDYLVVPPILSSESEVVDIQKGELGRGVVFDSVDDLIQGLVAFNNYADIMCSPIGIDSDVEFGPLSEAIQMSPAEKLIEDAMTSDGFVEQFLSNVKYGLEHEGNFHENFHNAGKGTRFENGVFSGVKVGDKYILKFSVPHPRGAEAKLAKVLSKPTGMVSSYVSQTLSVVDDWWFNIDFKYRMRNLPVSEVDICKVVDDMVEPNYRKEAPRLLFEYVGKEYSLDVSIRGVDLFLAPEAAGDWSKRHTNYLSKRGTSIVGASWTHYAENGNDIINPKPVNARIEYSVAFPGSDFVSPMLISPQEKQEVMAARNYICDLLKK